MTVRLLSRRELMKRSAQLVIATSVAHQAASQAAENPCADPNNMDSGEKSLRKSFNYVEASADPSQTCSICSFFKSSNGACGTCMMFNGGPANLRGHCDSWTRKEAAAT
jgi:hypothetical protein